MEILVIVIGKGKSNTSEVIKQMIDNDLQIILPNQIKKRIDLSQRKFVEYLTDLSGSAIIDN